MMQSTTSSTRTFASRTFEEEPKSKSERKFRRLLTRSHLPWLIVILLVVASAFMFWQYHQAKLKLTATNNQQASQLLDKLRKEVVLPGNETPTIATVVNASKISSQPFFAHAQDGDKVLLFNNEKEAILYRPSTGQVVNMLWPVNLGTTSSALTH